MRCDPGNILDGFCGYRIFTAACGCPMMRLFVNSRDIAVRTAVAVLLAVAALALGALLLLPGSSGPPSDAEMIRNLEARRAVFDRLVVMIREDKRLERVDDDWTRPEDPAAIGVPPERIAEYRRLFAAAGVPRGFVSYDGGAAITFIAYTFGLSVSGCAKSYVYSKSTPEDLVDGPLDSYHGQSRTLVRRAIGSDWYLEFDSS